jgi:hypothetical protein
MITTSIAVMKKTPWAARAVANCVRRIIAGLGLAIVLSGCSTIKLGYNNLDEITYWWLDGYVDFSDEQAPRVRDDIRRLLHWHRTQELPRFASILRAMEQAAGNDITPAQACVYVDQVRARLDALAEQAEPAVVTLATGLSPEQLAHLARKYEKNNARYRNDWIDISADERDEKRVDQVAERGEMVYGKLTDAQLALLKRELKSSAFEPARILAERMRRQRDAMETLRKVAGQPISFDEAKRLMRGYLDRIRQPQAPAERAYQQKTIEESCRVFAALHNSTSANQRQAAGRRLRAWQRDLTDLAAQK